MSANSKPALAILQLSAGGGVQVGEVESNKPYPHKSCRKTKLFTIVDISRYERLSKGYKGLFQAYCG